MLWLVAMVLGAEFTSKEDLANELASQVSIPTCVTTKDEILSEMARMVESSDWDPVAARWLGLKALDFHGIGDSIEAKKFYCHSFKLNGPLLLGDLAQFISDTNYEWLPILSEYFQRYRLRDFSHLSKDLADAIDEAPLSCFSGALVRRLTFMLYSRGTVDWPLYWPRYCLHCTKIYFLISLEFFPAKEVLGIIFYRGIEQFDHLVIVNEMNSRYDFELDSWIQSQPQETRDLLKAIRFPPNDLTSDLIREMIPIDFLQTFKSSGKIGYLNEQLSYLAFMARHWDQQLIAEQQFPLLAIATVFWKYPELLRDRPFLIQLLPEEMPPIQQLIPKADRFSVSHATVFKLLSHRYGFDRLEQAMLADGYSNNALFYLHISNDDACQGNSLVICIQMPKDLTEMEKASWLLHHFSRLEPVSEHNSQLFILGFPKN